VNGETLTSGDALLIQDEDHIQIKDGENAEVLVFELTA
jgi:redox-sensitive bicupin YhaK (pirin superfamily)